METRNHKKWLHVESIRECERLLPSEETPRLADTPGFFLGVRVRAARCWTEGDLRPVAVKAMRRGVAGAHPVLFLRSEARLGLYSLRLRH